MSQIACIVEGDSEVAALPILLRRIAAGRNAAPHIYRPWRVSRSKFIKSGEAERYVALACQDFKGDAPRALVVVIDADDDCPAQLGPELLDRCQRSLPSQDIAIGVVLAKYEWENWFIAAATSIAGQRRLHAPLHIPEDPESIRDAKGWLSKQMEGIHLYSPVLDMPALTRSFDLASARQGARSFDKFLREIDKILTQLERPKP